MCYAIGQFLSGALGDRLGPRIALTTGIILSGIATLAFGIFPFVGVMVVALSLNRLFQATGWANACKVVSQWVGFRHRGRLLGIDDLLQGINMKFQAVFLRQFLP